MCFFCYHVGTAIASQIRAEIKTSVEQLVATSGVVPGLAVVLVGDRRDSATYVRSKKKACAESGIRSIGVEYPATISEEELLAKIDELNAGLSSQDLLDLLSSSPIYYCLHNLCISYSY